MLSANYLVPKGARAVVPSDSTQVYYIGLYVGAAGNVAVVGEDGQAVTFVGVPAGSFIPMRVIQVKATGTTASSIVGFVV